MQPSFADFLAVVEWMANWAWVTVVAIIPVTVGEPHTAGGGPGLLYLRLVPPAPDCSHPFSVLLAGLVLVPVTAQRCLERD